MAGRRDIGERLERAYPEVAFGGFSRYDGTVAFAVRVRSLLRPRQTVLDIGCGRGSRTEDDNAFRRQLQDLRGEGRAVIGLDPDPGAAVNPYLDEFRLLEGSRWPIGDAEIDLVYGDYVLEHVEDPETFFAELRRAVRPGGFVCFRTPNRWGYASLVAQCVPNRWHADMVGFAQVNRKRQDVFPTRYRCNTRRALQRLLRRHGFDACVYAMEAEPSYLAFSGALYSIAARIHPMLPSVLRSTLLVFGRKQ